MGKKILPLILILILFTSVLTYGQIVMPEPTRIFYVNDFANVIDENVEASITKVNLNYEKTSQKPQIVVATVQNMQGLDENKYATDLFERWKIGNKEYNNGILIFLAIDERRIKIETGYGLEGAITDAEAGRILDSSTTYLTQGDYSKGIENIFFQLAKKVNQEYEFDDTVIFENMEVDVESNNQDQFGLLDIIKPILIIIVLVFLGGLGGGPGRRGRRRGYFIPPIIYRGGGNSGGGFGGGFGGGSFGGGGGSGGGGAGRGF